MPRSTRRQIVPVMLGDADAGVSAGERLILDDGRSVELNIPGLLIIPGDVLRTLGIVLPAAAYLGLALRKIDHRDRTPGHWLAVPWP